MKEHLLSLDTLNINLGSGEMVIVNFILAFVMFGVALSIRVSTLKSIFKKPKSVTIGLLLQWIALPALTCLLTTWESAYCVCSRGPKLRLEDPPTLQQGA